MTSTLYHFFYSQDTTYFRKLQVISGGGGATPSLDPSLKSEDMTLFGSTVDWLILSATPFFRVIVYIVVLTTLWIKILKHYFFIIIIIIIDHQFVINNYYYWRGLICNLLLHREKIWLAGDCASESQSPAAPHLQPPRHKPQKTTERTWLTEKKNRK